MKQSKIIDEISIAGINLKKKGFEFIIRNMSGEERLGFSGQTHFLLKKINPCITDYPTIIDSSLKFPFFL